VFESDGLEVIGVKAGTMIKQEDGTFVGPTPGVAIAASSGSDSGRDEDGPALLSGVGIPTDDDGEEVVLSAAGLAAVNKVLVSLRECFTTTDNRAFDSDSAGKYHQLLSATHLRTHADSGVPLYTRQDVSYFMHMMKEEFRSLVFADVFEREVLHKETQLSNAIRGKLEDLKGHLSTVADGLEAQGFNRGYVDKALDKAFVKPSHRALRRAAEVKEEGFRKRLRTAFYGKNAVESVLDGEVATDSSSGGEE